MPSRDDFKKYTNQELQAWLFEKARRMNAPEARKLVMKSRKTGQGSTIVGKVYFYKYDPKWKAILPKYDMFPLTVIIEPYSNGFLGLNLHYLSVGERIALLDELSEFASNDMLDETTRFLISYKRLKATSMAFSLAKPCVKRYLWTHCRSKFVEVYPTEFDKAVQLPVEDWVFNI